jgi:competence protein ComEC
MQWLLAVGLAPLLIVFFGSASLVSPLANLVAVPWISFVVVPLTLLGTLVLLAWPPAGTLLLRVAGELTDWLWPLLEGLARWLPALQWPQPPTWILLCTLVGIALLLAPRGWPGRWLGLLWCVPFLVWQPARPALGEVWLTMLDVGQGLAAVVETRDHVLVFDTGPSMGPDFDTGDAVVAPFLSHRGWRGVDVLMLSHGDDDHVGGARSIAAALPIGRVVAATPQNVNWVTGERCQRGMGWSWDGIRFEVLHPDRDLERNDGSCVLRVTTGGGALLLTGDIEAAAERELLDSGQVLRAQALVVPHHGSKSSSSDAFIAAVQPQAALFSVGYRNRYNFPSATVAERYQASGARRFDTARDGAVTIRMHSDGSWSSERWRESAARYWRFPGHF